MPKNVAHLFTDEDEVEVEEEVIHTVGDGLILPVSSFKDELPGCELSDVRRHARDSG